MPVVLDNQRLEERIKKSRFGIIKLNDGKITAHQTLDPRNLFEHIVYDLYIFANVKGVIEVSKRNYLRNFLRDDVKAIWMYLGSDLKVIGMQSKAGTSLHNMRMVLNTIDDVARIKQVHSISCATRLDSRVMSRIGYNPILSDNRYTYYRKDMI